MAAFVSELSGQTFDIAPGDTSSFAQQWDLGSITARYIKIDVDTTNGVANYGDAFQFAGLSEVQFLAYPPAGDQSCRRVRTRITSATNSTLTTRPERTAARAYDAAGRRRRDLSERTGGLSAEHGRRAGQLRQPRGIAVTHASPTDTISLPTDALAARPKRAGGGGPSGSGRDEDMVFACSWRRPHVQPPCCRLTTCRCNSGTRCRGCGHVFCGVAQSV